MSPNAAIANTPASAHRQDDSPCKLELRNIVKHYGEVEAVKGISFVVRDGEFVTIVGPSGCGKSSTLRMITGLEAITAGDLLIGGECVNELPARERDIALSFENYALYPHLSIFDNIAFPLQVCRTPPKVIHQRVSEILRVLHLEEVKDKRPSEVAGGQQQRTSLGRALVRNAAIYLIDEPLSHLDAQERTSLRAEIQRIQKTQDLTFIMVTHDQAEALAMSDRIIVMNDGHIMQDATPYEVYEYPENLFVADFIGEPPMNLLEGTLAKADEHWVWTQEHVQVDVSGVVAAMEGAPPLGDVTLGIRPAYVVPDKMESATSLDAEVFAYEFLGDTSLVTAVVADQMVRAMCPVNEIHSIGERIRFSLDPSHILIFDMQRE
jgi:ABC-type sugar transport system ATPase subunit